MAFDPLSSQGMMTALEMGYYVGAVLAATISPGDENPGKEVYSEIAEMYQQTREEYARHRTYYYSIVERFHGEEFWNKVTRCN